MTHARTAAAWALTIVGLCFVIYGAFGGVKVIPTPKLKPQFVMPAPLVDMIEAVSLQQTP